LVAEVVVEEPVGADQLRIVMNFTGECWTEVTDANGNRLFFGLGQQGQTVTRAGTPPFQALFGDRNNVNVAVDGADVPLIGGGRRGNTARVTIDAP
jgi:cytoskeleton protein RodZ